MNSAKIKLRVTAPKRVKKSKKPTQPEFAEGHKERFDQLLDDAVLGVKKK